MNLDFLLTKKIIEVSFQSSWLDTLGIFLASYIDYLAIFLGLLLLVWHFRATLLAFFTALFTRFFVVSLLRIFIDKPRPFLFFENVLAPLKEGNSFPSGHASFYFAFATILYFFDRKIGTGFLLISFLMSLSRVFTGYHWLYDVIAGALVGILIAFLAKYIYDKLAQKLLKNKSPK